MRYWQSERTYEYCALKLFHGVLDGKVYCCPSAQS
jgi:hypothetical protein